MITEKDLVPILHGGPALQEILAASGFTLAGWEALVHCELEASDRIELKAARLDGLSEDSEERRFWPRKMHLHLRWMASSPSPAHAFSRVQ